jgi:hypothetical protein
MGWGCLLCSMAIIKKSDEDRKENVVDTHDKKAVFFPGRGDGTHEFERERLWERLYGGYDKRLTTDRVVSLCPLRFSTSKTLSTNLSLSLHSKIYSLRGTMTKTSDLSWLRHVYTNLSGPR